MKESRVYLDTSIITKRYIKEENGDIADSHFHPVQCGETVITLSEINLGGAAAVFDKYSRKMGIDARVRLQTTVSELISLERSSSVEIYPVSRHIIQNAIRIVLEQHIYIYIVDAIQLATCIESRSTLFCPADKELNSTGRKLRIETIL